LETQLAIALLEEFRQVLSIQEGKTVEYEGREYIEAETVLGSSEKMIYYAREMVSQLNNGVKYLLNPFVVAKLDLNTIRQFDFAPVPLAQNKYDLRSGKRKVKGGLSIIKAEQEALVGIAKAQVKGARGREANATLHTAAKPGKGARAVASPSLLEVYCNIMELMRIRSEIIMVATECDVLQKLYTQ
jgi:hypothetical protein